METYGTSGALPARTWVDTLHRSLHLGDVGRLYSELAASWMWVVALGGVVLWAARNRRPRAGLRRLLLPGAGTSGGGAPGRSPCTGPPACGCWWACCSCRRRG
ncbi:PepSY-associated TM helix domain-containing protein [Nocardiopsis dassonvillei]